ncbi:PhzF family phenazine biosynthesis protein [Candidatus Woesearchaeota archaeon]|nr:PhzF family phenazine biosynthesis protein [Candidatus Woesearchaeota archaeon]
MVLVNIVHAFSKEREGGNPAGVVVDTDILSSNEMLSIASTLDFSESAFVMKSDVADFKCRFFTPTTEVNLCAHATLAAVYTMIMEKRIQQKPITLVETNAEILLAHLYSDGSLMMEQKNPEYWDPEVDRHRVALLLGIKEEQLMLYPIQTVSTGVPKLIIPVKSLTGLLNIKPYLAGITEYCFEKKINGFYPFTPETREHSDAHARQFNPLAGINEDPATGVAAGALGGYMLKHKLSPKKELVIEQGYIMQMPSRIVVDMHHGVRVGGSVRFVKKVAL